MSRKELEEIWMLKEDIRKLKERFEAYRLINNEDVRNSKGILKKFINRVADRLNGVTKDPILTLDLLRGFDLPKPKKKTEIERTDYDIPLYEWDKTKKELFFGDQGEELILTKYIRYNKEYYIVVKKEVLEEKEFEFQLIEKFIPPRGIKCSDCMNNPVPKLIEGFESLIKRVVINVRKHYPDVGQLVGLGYVETVFKREIKKLIEKGVELKNAM